MIEQVSGSHLELVRLVLFRPQSSHDFNQHFQRRAGSVHVAASVVADHNAIQAVLISQNGVRRALHALQHDRHLGEASEPWNVVPC